MMRTIAVAVVVTIAPITFAADAGTVARTHNMLNDLTTTAVELSKEAQRDAEVFRLLREAARSLDDWQPNVAISKALDQIGKAEQVAAQPPFAPRVRQATNAARQIVEPAKDNASANDLQRMRAQLQARPVEMMRAVVAEDVNTLAQLAGHLADVTTQVTKAVAAASATTVGSRSE